MSVKCRRGSRVEGRSDLKARVHKIDAQTRRSECETEGDAWVIVTSKGEVMGSADRLIPSVSDGGQWSTKPLSIIVEDTLVLEFGSQTKVSHSLSFARAVDEDVPREDREAFGVNIAGRSDVDDHLGCLSWKQDQVAGNDGDPCSSVRDRYWSLFRENGAL